MDESMTTDATVQKVLVHLYNSAVVGSLNSISLILRTKSFGQRMNPRQKELQKAYEALGPEHRQLFFSAVASIAEFAVYRALDFFEQYNRFDSEANINEFPRVELVYADVADGTVCQLPISSFGTEKLGKKWKEIARSDDIQQLVESAISKVLG